MTKDDDVLIEYDLKKVDTPSLKAVLYVIEGDEYWLPRSVIDDFEDGTVAVARWFAEKEGLV